MLVVPQVAAALLACHGSLEVDGTNRLVHDGSVVMVTHAGGDAVSGSHIETLPFGHHLAAPFEEDPVLVAVVEVAVEAGPLGVVHRVALILRIVGPGTGEQPGATQLVAPAATHADEGDRLAHVGDTEGAAGRGEVEIGARPDRFAIAAMAAAAGARVTLIAGPVHLPTPLGVDRVDVESAEEMAEAVRAALPADAAFMVAAVADWKASLPAGQKIKKRGSRPPALELAENPDILASLGQAEDRPALLIGFAAETENVVDNAVAKRVRKGADWIVANDVADTGQGSVMGGDRNRVHIVTKDGVETLDEMPKQDVARELLRRAAAVLEEAHD